VTQSGLRKIAGYELEGELAEGGMGVVRLARQPELDRRVVLKSLRRDVAEEPASAERFLREAQAAASLHHPNVVGVYDCFVWRGERTIAQEFVDGVDLATLLEKVGRLDARIAGLVALEAARGLEEIHARGLVHRDLKPSNLLLGRLGEVKIADFGIALDLKGRALTRTGFSVGTPSYMSPEQLLGARVDFRSDLFAFGVLLYEMLCGARPFESADPEDEALVRRIEAERYPSLRSRESGAPRFLAAVVRICLRGKPKRRFASTTALRRHLEERLGHPSPADCRRAIADWLEASGALPAPRQRTRRAKAVKPEPESEVASARPTPRVRAAVVWALALVLGAALFGTSWIDVSAVGQRLAQATSGSAWQRPGVGSD
jgi:serine/threonine-protein kinase